ncbi:LPXTG cell wall anchor domain-containing protein [Limosilactobacillus sp. c11Ua_112_M]|uniref:LPXTG cell wall anchor domain-containing protein n=1 Tax=Limosilactobacillus TaxID=2742598 RepID=UPI001783661C|nr:MULTISPECIES: LPXTG cell wall anchor domain-containing protein [Limosilactobacillus]MBD8087284.1 LPXTG cell wall anchor domain-containing protein [Limosilactobacillus portuensis]MEC4741764.1 LPXTG cell wall anchor domain-containing protein [Limosilactobacillus sp. c10Ua_36]
MAKNANSGLNTDNLQERLFGNDGYAVQELPQTGNNQKTGLILSFAGLLMIIGAIGARKKKH